MKTPVAALLVIVITAFYCNDAAADVAYSNLGLGDTFNTMVGLIVEGPDIPFNLPQTIADSFTSQVTGNISSIDVAVSGIADFNVSLQLNDPVTNLPLTSTNILLGTVTAPNFNYTLVTLTSVTPVTLVLGAKYWLVLSPATAALKGRGPSQLIGVLIRRRIHTTAVKRLCLPPNRKRAHFESTWRRCLSPRLSC